MHDKEPNPPNYPGVLTAWKAFEIGPEHNHHCRALRICLDEGRVRPETKQVEITLPDGTIHTLDVNQIGSYGVGRSSLLFDGLKEGDIPIKSIVRPL